MTYGLTDGRTDTGSYRDASASKNFTPLGKYSNLIETLLGIPPALSK